MVDLLAFIVCYLFFGSNLKPEIISFIISLIIFSPVIIFPLIVSVLGAKSNKNKKIYDTSDETRYNIKCKVCGKIIPYNKNGTCEDCHKLIIERIEKNHNIK